MYYLYILLVSFIEYFGDSNLKFYARYGGYKYLFLGISFYVLLINYIIKLLRMSNIIYMNVSWDITSAILESIMAFLFLGERLNNAYQYIGLVVSFLGMFLLRIGEIPI